MRSRYSAYAVGAVDYLIDTTDPEGPRWRSDRAVWAAEIAEFCEHTRFERLSVRSTKAEGDRGEVSFFAELSRAGQDVSFAEHSRFRRVAGRWLYVDGTVDDSCA